MAKKKTRKPRTIYLLDEFLDGKPELFPVLFHTKRGAQERAEKMERALGDKYAVRTFREVLELPAKARKARRT